MNHVEEQVAFYMQLGCALTQWAHVEDIVRRVLVGAFADDLNRKAVSVGFFSIDGFRAKIDFAEAVVKRVLVSRKPDQLQPWIALVDRARRASYQRNKLAHWRVMVYADGRAGRRHALEPWVQEKKHLRRHKDRPKPGALCLRDIVKLRHEFFSLTCALDNFLHRLAAEKERFPESAERPSNPPTIAKLRRQILEGFSFQPRGEILEQ